MGREKRTRKNGHLSFAEFYRRYGIYFTKSHTGKMEGMWSLNTFCGANEHCIKQQGTPGSSCGICYVNKVAKRFPVGAIRWAENTTALSENIIPVADWPYISHDVFRLESFGDLQSTLQAIHYINLAKSNPQTVFALWTKHPNYLKKAFDAGYEKPDNLIVIFSSFWLNKVTSPAYDFIDKVFTVFTEDYLSEHDVNINCGDKRHCNTCRRCYRRSKNGVEYINEIAKKGSPKPKSESKNQVVA